MFSPEHTDRRLDAATQLETAVLCKPENFDDGSCLAFFEVPGSPFDFKRQDSLVLVRRSVMRSTSIEFRWYDEVSGWDLSEEKAAERTPGGPISLTVVGSAA